MINSIRSIRNSVLVSALAEIFRRVHAWVAYALSFFERGDAIKTVHHGCVAIEQARRVAVFVHYDPQGRTHDFVFHYLRELADCGFAIVFVSNSPRLAADGIDRLNRLCALVVHRHNRGYDFGAYRDGIALIPDLGSVDQLVLANDSVYGPLHRLGPMLERMDARKAEVWGATDSWQHAFHIQSYFVLFHRAALQSKAFSDFWKGVRLVSSKTWVINKYEVRMTRALQRDGLRCRAVYAYRDIVKAILKAVGEGNLLHGETLPPERRSYLQHIVGAMNKGAPLNSPHAFWDFLIGNLDFPFLKRELIVKNPMKVPHLVEWERLVTEATEYDSDLIVRHLEISLKNRSI